MQHGQIIELKSTRPDGQPLWAYRCVRVTLADLAEEYLAQHDAEPETTAKLRWLLTKSIAAFGSTPLTELDAREIAAWRMTLPIGHRFEATQALRQTLARAVEWGLIDANPAKTGVDNPQPPRREMLPFGGVRPSTG